VQSAADLVVANTLEEAARWAYLGPVGSGFEKVKRDALAPRLVEALEALHAERSHG
jgi:phosphopantothenate-cysteine ligase